MKNYIVYADNLPAMLAASVVAAAYEQARCFDPSIPEPIAHAALAGLPLSISLQSEDKVIFIDYPVGDMQEKYLKSIGVSYQCIAQHCTLFDHYGIADRPGSTITSEKSAVLLAWETFLRTLPNEPVPEKISMLDAEIMKKTPDTPILRYFKRVNRQWAGTQAHYQVLNGTASDIGWYLLDEDSHDAAAFLQRQWHSRAQLHGTVFEPHKELKVYILQEPDYNCDQKVKALAEACDADIVISWIVTSKFVNFSIYSFGKLSALEFAGCKYPTGTPQKAGFSEPVARGLQLIDALLRHKN